VNIQRSEYSDYYYRYNYYYGEEKKKRQIPYLSNRRGRSA